MAETFGEQLAAALAFLYTGLVIGLLYDASSLCKRLLRARAAAALLDLLFLLLMGSAFSAALFFVEYGALRLYAFLLAALGVLLERRAIRAPFLRIYSKRFHNPAGK